MGLNSIKILTRIINCIVIASRVVLMLAVLISIGSLDNALFAQKKTPDLYLRAPDVIPGTLPEMRQVSYWIAKMENPDDVILNPREIEDRNSAYGARISNYLALDSSLVQRIEKQLNNRPGLLAVTPDINSMSDAQLSALVKDMIESQTNYLWSRDFGNVMSIEYATNELQEIGSEISYDPKRAIDVKDGITVQESRLHIIPSIKPEHIGLFTKGKARWDLWKLDMLPIGTPVQVLYASNTGAFLLVLTDRGYGWVASEKVAVGASEKIAGFDEGDLFVVCTGDRVPFYSDSVCTIFSGWLRMGDRLPLADQNTTSVNIPTRNHKGALVVQQAWFRPDADVQLGYLPYTRKHVAQQAFKLLDNLYDWTGAWFGRNHVTALRDIYRSFGFKLPANGVLLSAYEGDPKTVKATIDKEVQINTILVNEPFLTLQICENSHSQMFLGGYKGMPIVFDAHGYSYKDEHGDDLEIKRWVVGTMEMPDYFLKQDITFVKLY
jgi:hypothetical protein